MIITAKKAQHTKLTNDISLNPEISVILDKIRETSRHHNELKCVGEMTDKTIQTLKDLGFVVNKSGDRYVISWYNKDYFEYIDERFDNNDRHLSAIRSATTRITALCIAIILLLIGMNLFGAVIWQTKQVGLVAIIDTPSNSLNIPDYDPDAIIRPDDDKVQKLNEKLDQGKMCINMRSHIIFDNALTSGKVDIVNDDANNYPQFVTITLDDTNAQIYQSGLIEVGKSVPYAQLDIELPKGEYTCTAIFSQVDTTTNKICGQAAAKIKITVNN